MKIRDSFAEKFELYILSLWLLFFLVIVVTVDVGVFDATTGAFLGWLALVQSNTIPLIVLVFLVAGGVYYFRFDYRISGSTSIPVKVTSVSDLTYEHLTFLTTYIIPLVCIDLTKERYVVVMIVLLAVIGVIYVKTDKFYANPSLSLLGFRLYKATVQKRTGDEVEAVLITKSRIAEGSMIKYLQLDDRVFFSKETK